MAASNGSSRRKSPEGTTLFARAMNRGLNKLRNSLHRLVERVAFDRFAARITNQLFDLIPRYSFSRRRTRTMNDAFFDDRSVQIVRTKLQRDLRECGSESDPVGFYMREIFEHQA